MSKNHILNDYALIEAKLIIHLDLFQFGASFDPTANIYYIGYPTYWDSHYLKIQYREAWGNNWLHPMMTTLFRKDRWK